MKKSNYEITKERAQEEFLKYPQEKMIEKFSLKHDADYLYLEFIKREFRIDRKTGKITYFHKKLNAMQDAMFDETLSIFDVLCESKENCQASGRFCKINNLKGTVKSAFLGEDLYQKTAEEFDGKLDLLERACERLGGRKESIGDVSYQIDIFPFLSVIFQFWESDEEFPPCLKVMWDENVLNFMRYETTYYVLNHLLERIKEEMFY